MLYILHHCHSLCIALHCYYSDVIYIPCFFCSTETTTTLSLSLLLVSSSSRLLCVCVPVCFNKVWVISLSLAGLYQSSYQDFGTVAPILETDTSIAVYHQLVALFFNGPLNRIQSLLQPKDASHQRRSSTSCGPPSGSPPTSSGRLWGKLQDKADTTYNNTPLQWGTTKTAAATLLYKMREKPVLLPEQS